MFRSQPIFLVFFALLLLALSCSFLASEKSAAAGCNKSIAMGSCFGTTAIIHLSVDPVVECLKVEADNCLGGLLDVKNSCQESFTLEEIEIPPSVSSTFELVEEDNGQISLIEFQDYHTEYMPDENKSVVFIGMLGNQEIELKFTKTVPLCER